MATVTVYVPEEVYNKMKKYKEISWSRIIRREIIQILKRLEEVDYRLYALKRLEEGEDASELFKF